jgi:V8-like Glu-specific endopeptidase
MRPLTCALAFAIGAVAVQSAVAQTFDVRRASVLATDMRVEPVTPPRVLTAVDVQLPVTPSGAAAVRLHLRIVRADAGAPWVVMLSDSQGTIVQRIDDRSPFVSAAGVWTDDVPGASARVSIAADAAKVQIAVDRVAIAVTPSVPQAIVGQNELTPITDASVPAKVKQWASAIAKLRFMVGDDEALCTGFLVGADLLMTNQHCITTDEEAQSAVVEFGFDSDAAAPVRLRVAKVEATDFSLDYSLLRLSAAPPSQFVRLHFGAAPGTSALLAIVQHPGGQPKQVSFVPNCAAGTLAVAGRQQPDTDFGHVCDTLGGSSGSPVLDWSTGQVVGLHHLGFRPGIDKPENQGVHVSLILADTKSKVSDAIYQEIIR